MRKLDFNEYKLCQILGSIFEKSTDLSSFSSLMFVRRFMMSPETSCFFDKSYLTLSTNEEDIIKDLNEKYETSKEKKVLSKDKMYWIGYIYGALSFLYDLSGKAVYKLFPAKEIVKYYNIYHTYGIEEAAERMMENIGYKSKDFTTSGVQILKRLYFHK